ncbi:MAG: oxidoreductase, partial [Stackebrandtia sp.]
MATSPNGIAGPQPAGRADSRLDVGVVSAGRVGATLGAALARAGHH